MSRNDECRFQIPASVTAPIGQARSLPREAFTSDAFFDLERDAIFTKRWVAVLFDQEIPGVGDAKPFTVFDIPLFAVRGEDGAARVFHNICPYDGCLALLRPKAKLKEIEAPYHGWRYDLEGKLKKTPFWSGAEDTPLAALNGRPGDLEQVNAATWNGVLFVNLSDAPEPFAHMMAPLENLLRSIRLEDAAIELDENGRAIVGDLTWNANWKTICENVCLNVLHEGFVHTAYRASPEIPRVDDEGNPTFFNVKDGALLGFGYAFDELEETYGSFEFPHLGVDDGKPPETGYYLALYPSLNISVWPNLIEYEIMAPLSPGATQLRTANFFEKDAASNPKLADARKRFAAMFQNFIVEDQQVVEAVQKARRSPAFESQYYSEFWDENYYNLTQLIVKDLERGGRVDVC